MQLIVSKEYREYCTPFGHVTLKYHVFFVSVKEYGTVRINKFSRSKYVIPGDYADLYDAKSKKQAIHIATQLLFRNKSVIEGFRRKII